MYRDRSATVPSNYPTNGRGRAGRGRGRVIRGRGRARGRGRGRGRGRPRVTSVNSPTQQPSGNVARFSYNTPSSPRAGPKRPSSPKPQRKTSHNNGSDIPELTLGTADSRSRPHSLENESRNRSFSPSRGPPPVVPVVPNRPARAGYGSSPNTGLRTNQRPVIRRPHTMDRSNATSYPQNAPDRPLPERPPIKVEVNAAQNNRPTWHPKTPPDRNIKPHRRRRSSLSDLEQARSRVLSDPTGAGISFLPPPPEDRDTFSAGTPSKLGPVPIEMRTHSGSYYNVSTASEADKEKQKAYLRDQISDKRREIKIESAKENYQRCISLSSEVYNIEIQLKQLETTQPAPATQESYTEYRKSSFTTPSPSPGPTAAPNPIKKSNSRRRFPALIRMLTLHKEVADANLENHKKKKRNIFHRKKKIEESVSLPSGADGHESSSSEEMYDNRPSHLKDVAPFYEAKAQFHNNSRPTTLQPQPAYNAPDPPWQPQARVERSFSDSNLMDMIREGKKALPKPPPRRGQNRNEFARQPAPPLQPAPPPEMYDLKVMLEDESQVGVTPSVYDEMTLTHVRSQVLTNVAHYKFLLASQVPVGLKQEAQVVLRECLWQGKLYIRTTTPPQRPKAPKPPKRPLKPVVPQKPVAPQKPPVAGGTPPPPQSFPPKEKPVIFGGGFKLPTLSSKQKLQLQKRAEQDHLAPNKPLARRRSSLPDNETMREITESSEFQQALDQMLPPPPEDSYDGFYEDPPPANDDQYNDTSATHDGYYEDPPPEPPPPLTPEDFYQDAPEPPPEPPPELEPQPHPEELIPPNEVTKLRTMPTGRKSSGITLLLHPTAAKAHLISPYSEPRASSPSRRKYYPTSLPISPTAKPDKPKQTTLKDMTVNVSKYHPSSQSTEFLISVDLPQKSSLQMLQQTLLQQCEELSQTEFHFILFDVPIQEVLWDHTICTYDVQIAPGKPSPPQHSTEEWSQDGLYDDTAQGDNEWDDVPRNRAMSSPVVFEKKKTYIAKKGKVQKVTKRKKAANPFKDKAQKLFE